jgi:hypothetical protein
LWTLSPGLRKFVYSVIVVKGFGGSGFDLLEAVIPEASWRHSVKPTKLLNEEK